MRPRPSTIRRASGAGVQVPRHRRPGPRSPGRLLLDVGQDVAVPLGERPVDVAEAQEARAPTKSLHRPVQSLVHAGDRRIGAPRRAAAAAGGGRALGRLDLPRAGAPAYRLPLRARHLGARRHRRRPVGGRGPRPCPPEQRLCLYLRVIHGASCCLTGLARKQARWKRPSPCRSCRPQLSPEIAICARENADGARHFATLRGVVLEGQQPGPRKNTLRRSPFGMRQGEGRAMSTEESPLTRVPRLASMRFHGQQLDEGGCFGTAAGSGGETAIGRDHWPFERDGECEIGAVIDGMIEKPR